MTDVQATERKLSQLMDTLVSKRKRIVTAQIRQKGTETVS
jgi:hypothetical protein